MALTHMAERLSGRLIGADASVNGLSTDSRTVPEGALFVALQGPNFDGHAYLDAARARGAAAALVSQEQASALPQLLVPDTLVALQQLSALHRQAFNELTLVGLTGSNGKTGTKAIIAELLRAAAGDAAVLATEGNLNNHIGVPLTLARLGQAHRYAVIEMGANHPGEIDQLAQLAQPTIGLVTNAAAAHLEGFGDIDTVAETKGAVFRRLDADGTAVINRDSPFYDDWRASTQAAVLSFGSHAQADVRLRSCAPMANGKPGQHIRIDLPGDAVLAADLALLGKHNAINATAAVAVGVAAAIPAEAMVAGLQAVRPVPGRLSPQRLPAGGWLIDDAYNANPASMRAAIDLLAEQGGATLLVIGTMAELGANADAEHAALGEYAQQRGVQQLVTIGPAAAHAAAAFGPAAQAIDTWQAAVTRLEPELPNPQLRLLVKASRSAGLDRLVNALLTKVGGVAC